MRTRLAVFLLLAVASVCQAETAAQAVRAGNRAFAGKDWQAAITAYERAAAIDPASQVPQFNKSGALYESGDFKAAADGFRAVAGESRDLPIVAKAKYNLANCAFKEGLRQKDSDLKKAIESIQQAIVGWREVLTIQPDNQKARGNIDKAALLLKQLMDEQKKKQDEQSKDPNSQNQQQKQDGQQDTQQKQQKQQQQQDPNNSDQKQDQNKQAQDKKDQQANKQEDKKDEEKKDAQQQKAEQEQKKAPDATAEQILADEQDRKKELQPNQQGGYQPVDQDW